MSEVIATLNSIENVNRLFNMKLFSIELFLKIHVN